MAQTITLKLSQDEVEMLVDALETDLEGYADAIKEARGNANRDDVATFTEAATRIMALKTKVQEHIDTE